MDSLSLGVLPWDLRLTSDSVKGCGGTIHKRGALIPFPCKLNPKWISSICRHHKLQIQGVRDRSLSEVPGVWALQPPKGVTQGKI